MRRNLLHATTLQYPTTSTNSSRVITDSYGTSGSMDDEINQLYSIIDGTGTTTDVTTSTTLDTVSQTGDGTVVAEDYNEPAVGYNLLGTTGDQPNMDQFGRVQDVVWSQGDTMLDGYAYTYNLQGDVATRQNLALDAYNTTYSPMDPVYLDQVYGSDQLDQLLSLSQGKLSDGAIATGTENYQQNWTLDGFGNWSNYTVASGSGGDLTTTVDQDRQTNSQNQIQNYNNGDDESTSSWAVPGYDAAGNMTTVPQPNDETNGLTCQFDAWDRLAE